MFIFDKTLNILHAKQFADFHDFRARTSSKNDYYCQWYWNLQYLNTVVEDVNKRRAEIGLGTHEQRLRELKNFIEGRKQRNNPKPYVKIIY